MRALLLASIGVIALVHSGCRDQHSPGMSLIPSPKPTQAPVEPCYLETIAPAKFFAVDVPRQAQAEATFSLTVWLSQPFNEAPLQRTFEAKIADVPGVVTVTGSVTRNVPNPKARGCVTIDDGPEPFAATVSVPIKLPAGKYTVLIPPANFIAEVPINPPLDVMGHPFVMPPATATFSLEVR